ncbi:Protein bark beetle [Halotydeus destructor]|nr:Protein bark beetle [Halotydeus destructor]
MTNRPVDMYHPKSYAIALHGIQFVNITRNLLNNPNLQFELLAGVLTGSLDNKLNAKENWWGYFAPDKISQRIFDFDDWNSYSVADFSPFLATEHFDAITVPVDHSQDDLIVDLSRPLGGKISRHVLLQARAEPYIVKSDLTIMPGAALVIEADVVLEFYPSVGLLVLGEMTIAGYDSKPVIMRPVSLIDLETRFKRQAGDTSQNGVSERKRSEANELTNVRMCITESCSEWNENGSVKPRDGFLEVYNSTTLQWMAVCDERFTERNAQVVCRQLGYSSINAHLRRGSRYDVGPTMMSRVRYWPEPMECDGRENFVSECKVRLNGYGNHSHACTHNGDSFVYIFCGREPDSTYLAPSAQEGKHYWGGVRFARPRFEPNEHGVLRSDSNFRPSRIREQAAQSRIQHLNIIGAGILHGEKNAAIQLVQRDVNLEFVNVSDCAYHGIEVIAPSGNLAFHRLELRRNLGAGINYLLLGGASSGVATIPYKPLSTSTIPYNLYGLVDVCDTNKKLIVEERVIVYHKYDNHPVDCVKIFAATHSAKRLGFRVLQFNMFNSTNYAAVTDSIQIVDGDIFNQTSRLIGDLGVTEAHRLGQPELKFYSSTEATLSIRLHASGAASSYGFIAEVVTMPVSYYAGRGHFHNVTFSEISGNTMGAITYNAAGETAPSVAMDYNRFEYNCQEFHGNFTSCNSSIDLEIQNSPQFFFRNNLVTGNYGGLRLQVNAQSAAASLYGLLINNLFERNKNNEVLYVQGPQQGSYQVVEMANNYFTYNTAKFKSNIVLDKVVANFTSNVIVANTGRHQLEVLGFEQVPISYQTIRGNWFYNNMAIGSGQFGYGLNGDERSTIFASNAGQRYVENYLVNPENDFELATMNRSDLYNYDPRAPSQTAIAYRKSSVDARENWWGFNESSAIASRVLEQSDYIDLVRVEYTPFHSSNHSVLSGICPGGWSSIGHTCFVYIGARMTFAEAQRFCERQNSTMPVVRANRRELTDFLYEQQDRYDHRFFRVWVQSFDFDVTECTVLVDTAIEKNKGGCYERLPFFCEKDPDIRVFIGSWYREPLGIAALAVSTVTAILTMCCLCCWMCKSREKAKEKLQRRNSIRASIRSNRSVIYSSNAGSINGIAYQKSYDKVLIAPRSVGSGSTQLDTAPLNSMSPVKYSRTGSINSTDNRPYVDEGEKVSYNPAAVRPRSAYRPLEDRFANDASLENANATLLAHPTFDLTFQNEAFQATPTPTASRASNMEYTEATDWTLQGTPPAPSSPPVKQLPAPPSPSYGEFPRQTPSPPTGTQRFNTYESAAAYETLPRRDLTFSTFGGVKVLPVAPPARPRPPPRIGGNFSTSQNSLLQGAGGSDITAATHLTTNTNRTDGSKRYLETSLDGDSIQENNYDYYDYRFRSIEQQRAQSRSSPSISILTASSKETSKSKPALETAM